MSASEPLAEPLASTTANPDRTAATVDYSGPSGALLLDIRDRADAFLRAIVPPGCMPPLNPVSGHALSRLADALIAYDTFLADEVEAAGTDNTTRSATP